MHGPSVEFFDRQFARQAAAGEYALNPFERLALPYLARGASVLDLGCGLGNLALAAAGQGAAVTALDASPQGIADLRRRAAQAGAAIEAREEDLRRWRPELAYDAVVCIGLLMFFAKGEALGALSAAASGVAPGGVAIVNVLTEGTTYLGMFDPAAYHLFTREELLAPFAGWDRLELREDEFPAPEATVKRFLTLVARRTFSPQG